MALDPNISLGVKGLQLADPLQQYSQVAQLQSAQNQNALAQYQLGSAQRAEQSQNMLADAYKQSVDPTTGKINFDKLNSLVAAGGGGALLPGIQKTQMETRAAETLQQKHLLEVSAAKTKQLQTALRDISSRPSDANITAHTEDILASSLFTPEEKAKSLTTQKMLLAMPFEQRGGFLASQGATAGELKPTVTNQTLGGTVRAISTAPFGGAATVVPGSEAAVTSTPAQIEANRIRAGQLQVAQSRLAAESATGVLSPDSQELAANLYLTTGTLPPMGIGKGGAALKASIMNRAAEISKSAGATPAAGAANIVAAKQDVGTQTKALKDFSTGVQGQMVTSFNTAIDHLGTMDKLVDALNNGDVKAFNSLGNAVAKQTGAPAPTNFDTARHIVGAEIQKAIIRAGGTGKEREEAANAFANAGSPAQLKGVIDTYKQLLGGQLNSLEMQYTANTGRKDFNKKLSATAQETVKKLRGESGAAAPASGGVDTGNPLLR